MVFGQFSDNCGLYLRSANIRKLTKDHKGYGSAGINTATHNNNLISAQKYYDAMTSLYIARFSSHT